MGLEIERKFLVAGDGWCAGADRGLELRQGYLNAAAAPTVRVRLAADCAWLTIKGESRGAVRAEFEYAIPPTDARELLGLCGAQIIAKTRYRVDHAGRAWVVDVFTGANAGLVLAEVELDREDAAVAVPAWAGREVTLDPRYRNSALARHPYTRW